MDTDFIGDDKLRERINVSIEYIFALYEDAKDNESIEFQKETYRVIILYTVSIIEALLFSIYHELDEFLYRTDYKDTVELKEQYTHTVHVGSVIVATRTDVKKTEHEIGFQELLMFLKKSKVLKKITVDRIIKINSLRNSFHFLKKGDIECKIEDVEEALSLLELTLKGTPRFVS